MQILLSVATYITDLLFPRVCGGCGKNGTFLCNECVARIPKAEQPKNSFITAIFDYKNPVIRQAIWRFKYKNARGVAKCFSEALYEEIIGEIGDHLHVSKYEKFLLVPIPLHKKRLRERGYNQSNILANEIIKHDSEKLLELAPNALIRTHATKPQAKREARAARFENLRGAFKAYPLFVRGKHVILIDDVTTTGATFSEARNTLLSAGARSVRAYAVAH